jgi:hypothetical protein
MELHEALAQIAEIRQQMARSEVFRGYRSATTAFSAVVAVAAAAVQQYCQQYWQTDDHQLAWHVLYLWAAAAALSLVVVGTEMVIRYRRNPSVLQRQITLVAVEQFVPCLVAGALMTYVLSYVAAWNTLLMLPGLWAILFGLGVFASRRVLPRGTALVGAWYLMAGLLCLMYHRHRQPDEFNFAKQMAFAFGGGQLLAAGVLYWMLERRHGRS